MNLVKERTESDRHPKSSLSAKQKFAIAAFPNWAELFQHLQTMHGGLLDIQPRGLIGLQHLWPPERRFDIQLLEDLGTVAHFTLHNPPRTVFCSGDLVRPLTSNLVGAGGCRLTDILEHWVAPVEAERLSRAVVQGNLILWTSANTRV